MSNGEKGKQVAGRLILALEVTGWIGVIGCVVYVMSEDAAANAGLFLIAAALAFGLAANAVLRS